MSNLFGNNYPSSGLLSEKLAAWSTTMNDVRCVCRRIPTVREIGANDTQQRDDDDDDATVEEENDLKIASPDSRELMTDIKKGRKKQTRRER